MVNLPQPQHSHKATFAPPIMSAQVDSQKEGSGKSVHSQLHFSASVKSYDTILIVEVSCEASRFRRGTVEGLKLKP
jgi:hypothetical protein